MALLPPSTGLGLLPVGIVLTFSIHIFGRRYWDDNLRHVQIQSLRGADVICATLVGALNPVTHPFLFPNLSGRGLEGLTVLLYTAIAIAVAGVLNLGRNFRYTSGLPWFKRLPLAFSGRRITVEEFLRSKFLFPLTEITEDGNLKLRTTFSVDEDDSKWRETFRLLLEQGKIGNDTYIWVAWGVPVLTFMLAAYVFSLMVGLPV